MLNRRKNFGSLCAVLGLVMVFTFLTIPPASATVSPGPDKFGYVAKSIGTNPRNISTTGTLLSLKDDDVSDAIPIQFDFIFYGLAYNEVYISSNGFISFSFGEGDGWSDLAQSRFRWEERLFYKFVKQKKRR